MSPRHSEYLGLSNEYQIRNARNVRVNAQVTAVVTIFEVVGMCIIVMTHLLAINQGFSGLEFVFQSLFMLLHFVILPYAFLMNTTSNKNRIIEDGWMNVLKNIVFCYKCSTIAPASSANEASTHSEKITDADKKPATPSIFLISKASQSVASKTTAVQPFPKSIDGESTEPSIEMQEPTCSFKRQDLTNFSNKSTEKGGNVKGTKSNDSFRQKMISNLLTSVEDEDLYRKILIHFIYVEEAHKAGKGIDTSNHNYEQLKIDTLPNFVGCSKRKLAMRTSKLQVLLQIRKKTDSYRIHFDQFVDMEETFIENGC